MMNSVTSIDSQSFKGKAKLMAGTRFTVLLECVDEEASVALLDNLFSDKSEGKLVAGCRVIRVDLIDQLDNVKFLKHKIQELHDVLVDMVKIVNTI